MTNTGFLAFSATLLLLTAALATAQPTAPVEEEVVQDTELVVEESASNNADGDQGSATTGAQEDSPYDYRSSEEISEDLSVSFPVDI